MSFTRLLVLASILVTAACGGTGAPPPSAGAGEPGAVEEPSPSQAPALPDTPAGQQLAWYLEVLEDGDGDLDVEIVTERLSGDFLAAVPAQQFAAITRQLATEMSPIEVTKVTEASPLALTAFLDTRQGKMRLELAVLEEEPHRIEGLLIRPGAADVPRPTSWAEVDSFIEGIAPQAQYLAAVVEDDGCRALKAANPKEALAIGSTFKLYVLLAAAEAVAEGTLAWDQPIAIRDEWKSLPSGTLQDRPAGDTLTMHEIATAMIESSDNTATDHLLYTVGRDQVEATVARTGHAAPDRNIPFLSTREMFILKLDHDGEQIDSYLADSPEDQRAYLDETVARMPASLDNAADWTSPRLIAELEWFASAEDLCGIMAALKAAGQSDPKSEVLTALSQNAGVSVDKKAWQYVGFKGGSEPGVMNLTWLLQRNDGAWLVFTIGANDTGKDIRQDAMVAAAEGALALLAEIGLGDEQ